MFENKTLSEYLTDHITQSMDRAQSAERYPVWLRSCPELSDIDFVRLGLMRCISVVDSGRHFLQNTDDIHDELIPTSTYFNSLKSARRANMLEALEKQSYQLHCKTLQEEGIDYLKALPELDGFIVEAADGHFIDHACHTEKNNKGKVYAAGFIYALNLRNGLLSPICTVTNGTRRSHEIPVLRNQLEKNNKKKLSGQKNLYIYDKAVTDYDWWNSQKSQGNYMVSVLKENSSATLVEAIPFDNCDVVNTGVEGYDVYKTDNGIRFSVVTYQDPETQQLYQFISTLPLSINPGAIAILYFKRWTIEKAFNNSKSDFKERKAWSSDGYSLKNQMRLTAMSYNFMRVFEELSKQLAPEMIHPSEKSYNKTLEKRQKIAKKQGCYVSPLLFYPRITRISSYTIRGAQSALTTGRSFVSFMKKLIAHLVPRVELKVEH